MRRAKTLLFALVIAALFTSLARAASDQGFYKGKTINLYVGFPPGGGYDIYARIFAPYFSKHIPGNPTLLLQNMTGGSGVRAAGYISQVTAQDGTSLGIFLDGLTLGKILGGQGDFDPLKLQWIGRITSTATVAIAWHTAPALTVEESKSKQLIVAASVGTSTSSIIPLVLNDLIGTKFKVIRGYQGSPKQALALEEGEVQALGAMAWEAITTTKAEWLKDSKIRVLYVHGAKRIKELADAPAIVEFATDEASRQILSLVSIGPDIGRSIVAEPGTPTERAALLRQAFMETMSDPAFAAEMKKHHLAIEPMPGEELQMVVASAMQTPQELVVKVRRYIK